VLSINVCVGGVVCACVGIHVSVCVYYVCVFVCMYISIYMVCMYVYTCI